MWNDAKKSQNYFTDPVMDPKESEQFRKLCIS